MSYKVTSMGLYIEKRDGVNIIDLSLATRSPCNKGLINQLINNLLINLINQSNNQFIDQWYCKG